jgi:hypothetical protein
MSTIGMIQFQTQPHLQGNMWSLIELVAYLHLLNNSVQSLIVFEKNHDNLVQHMDLVYIMYL